MERPVSQDHFNKLINLTESRYLLSKIVAIRAAQLKKGVPSTLTAKAIRSSDNAVSVAMTEVAQRAGIIWGSQLPDDTVIARAVEQDRLEAQREADQFSVTREAELYKTRSH